ncbi:hypothetical protein GF314_16025 [bacterium]|nr:hypothetical protein [bacterium]
MNVCKDFVQACAEVGLRFRLEHDRSVRGYALELREDGAGEQILDLRIGEVRECHLRLVDACVARRTVLTEVSIRTMKREPAFDLWLEAEDRQRYLVARRDGAWELTSVDGDGSLNEPGG